MSQFLPLTSAKQKIGQGIEALASQYLQAQGLILIEQNWLQPQVGELDLVMLLPATAQYRYDTLVFVEVRGRSSMAYGGAAASITKAKQRKLKRAAEYFLCKHPEYADHDCRFDVLAVQQPSDGTYLLSDEGIDWIQAAFF